MQIRLGDSVMVSDPCYSVGTWCQQIIEDVLEGDYIITPYMAELDGWGNRVVELVVIHKKYKTHADELISGDIGVDSGICGVYDLNYFVESKNVDSEKFFAKACDVANPVGTQDYSGVATRSGCGDGMYACYVGRRKDGKIVSIRLSFAE